VRHWDAVLGTVQVRTPDRSMDIMLNRWLLYQTLSCRMWARCGFYQASGAYGFRDQLQDGMALHDAAGDRARAPAAAAARQFVEGDVQHWWLPASGEGVRTRISDDRSGCLRCAHYVDVDGDAACSTSRSVPARPRARGRRARGVLPSRNGTETARCSSTARARSMQPRHGVHGLPLIGTGDWNDGMNRVGEHGAGRACGSGWFLCATLEAFAPLAKARGRPRAPRRGSRTAARCDPHRAERLGRRLVPARLLRRRDAARLVRVEECRIDSIAQSWACYRARRIRPRPSRHGRHGNAPRAPKIVWRCCWRRRSIARRSIRLHRGYPPGIRENGGQYTHAVTGRSSLSPPSAGRESRRAVRNGESDQAQRHAGRRAALQGRAIRVAADVYSTAPHEGRGGWTWYTGAAGWLYRAGIEAILGVRRQGEFLFLHRAFPAEWPGFEVDFRFHSARYENRGREPGSVGHRVSHAELDGEAGVTAARAGSLSLTMAAPTRFA
jgi:cyclic beta-1,2-glucan synthetase